MLIPTKQDEEIPKVAPKPSKRHNRTEGSSDRKDSEPSEVEAGPSDIKQDSTAVKPEPEPVVEPEPIAEPEPVVEPVPEPISEENGEPKINGVSEEIEHVPTETPVEAPDSFVSNQATSRQDTNGSEQVSSPTEQTPSEASQGGEKPDTMSYEERREARRRDREKRLKAAAALAETAEPKQSYHERKQREQLKNAQENRKKWEQREEDSGEK